jgi:probable F420-dependent oxidoreductase
MKAAHYGLAFANTGPAAQPDYAVRFARSAEAAGFESLWTVEHVIWPEQYSSAYPYSPSGKMAGDPSTAIPDPLVWLSWVGAATETIRLATGILLLPERQPLVVAKEAATLDVLSGGRLDLGVGIGWLREEFDALGVPFAGRAARTDEYIEVMRAVWAGDDAQFTGEFARFAGVSSNPKPSHGSVPIFIGGHSKGAARRAGRLGDGFWPVSATTDGYAELFAVARQTAEESGRDPGSIELCASPPRGLRNLEEDVTALLELGVDRIIVPGFYFFAPEPERALEAVVSRLP